MIKLFLTAITFISVINANLLSNNYNQNDINILKELDIPSYYITDYKLQKTYEYFLEKRKNKFIEHLNNASLFVPKIKEILKNNDIPSSFLFMVMAESNFSTNAKSHLRAAGLWQFMNATANKYGLKNDLYVDERLDIVKSTIAATKYLKYLHNKFDKWYIAAIAYNCGEGRVIEGITRATIDMYAKEHGESVEIRKYRDTIKDYQIGKVRFREVYKIYKKVLKWEYKPTIDDLLKVQTIVSRQYIPEESREYIRKIISFSMMINRDFILDESHLLNLGANSSIATVKVKGGTHLKNVAKIIDMNYDELSNLNSHIKQFIISPYIDEYDIYIPYSKLSMFNINKNKIQNTKFLVYEVKRGDTLASIGKNFDIDYKLIKEFNDLNSNILSLKQKLVIPVAPEMLPKPDIDYIVKSGDTLQKIAKLYSKDVSLLMKENNLETSLIRIGDKIVIKNSKFN